MLRRTKIIATLGPACHSLDKIRALILAGVDVFRINFSHGNQEEHKKIALLVREASIQSGKEVGLLGDLQGPKIRIGCFEENAIHLHNGDLFTIDQNHLPGNQYRVGTDYKNLARDVKPGEILLLDDGKIALKIQRVSDDTNAIECIVQSGGELKNQKGINKKGGGLNAGALTAKDVEDIKFSAEVAFDFIAVSFPRSAADLYMARELLKTCGQEPFIIAKIERAEAIENLDDILSASDGVMVARGDLAVEVGNAAVPGLQKTIVSHAREANKITIIATQMMESMIQSPVPTRAEASDVANAVLDGTDAVMLSAETATGQYPVETVSAMHHICIEAERFDPVCRREPVVQKKCHRIDQVVAMSAAFAAYHMKATVIACMTETGSTALWISRMNCGMPIYAFSPGISSRRRMSIFRDVYPLPITPQPHNPEELYQEARAILLAHDIVQEGDYIITTIGEPLRQTGGTNSMKIFRV